MKTPDMSQSERRHPLLVSHKPGPARSAFIRRALLALLAATTASCATVPGPTTRCVTKEQLEQLKRDEPEKVAPKLTGKADEDTRTLAGSAIRLRAWGNGLLTVLGGCVSDE